MLKKLFQLYFQFPPIKAWIFLMVIGLLTIISVLYADIIVYNYINDNLANYEIFAQKTTHFAKGLYWFILAFALLILSVWQKKIRKFAVLLLASLTSSGIILTLLKNLVGRARPDTIENAQDIGQFFDANNFLAHIGNSDFNSFPSGHSQTIMVVWFCLMVQSRYLGLLTLPVALWLVSTRLLINAHYLSDAIFGAGLGIFFCIWIHKLYRLSSS